MLTFTRTSKMSSNMAHSHLLLLLLLLTFSLPTATPTNPAELRALLELKSTLDPAGRILTTWTPAADPCSGEFDGVACNEHGKVANISLQGKGLTGSISPAVKDLRCLSGLYLHYNGISGEIPGEIGELMELEELYLNVNNLSGGIPEEIGGMVGLQVLQLCYNQLTGSIPTKLGLLKNLNVIALQSNRLTGAIPASLGDLAQLMRLDLSYNQLFGSIPTKLAQAPQLVVLNLRNNSLSGNVPSDLKKLNDKFQYGNNTDLCGVGFPLLRSCAATDPNTNRPEPFSPGSKPEEIPQSANLNTHCNDTSCLPSSKSHVLAAVVGTISMVVGGMVCGILAFAWYRRRKQKISGTAETPESRHSIDNAKDLSRRGGCGSPLANLEYSNGWDPLADGKSGLGFSDEVSQSLRFNLEEVECATQHFAEVNLLGKKNSFAATYRGILRDGTAVAVKKINKTSCKSEEVEFLKGLKIVTLLQHENLVRLRGFCCSRGRGECFLVYDFVANGDLSHYLDVNGDESGRILVWPTRVLIIRGIAKGIEYLHNTKVNKLPLLHQTISAEKILIDEHLNPLLSDSGLHKLLTDDVVFSSLKASAAMGYLAPEYTTVGRFTEKSDVYAFGVLMLQILTGKGSTTNIRLRAESNDLETLIDENLKGNFSRSEAAKLAAIAMLCTSDAPERRPAMEEVLQELNNI